MEGYQSANYAAQNSYNAANAQTAAPPTTRLELLSKGVDRMREIISGIEMLADRIVGSLPPSASPPGPSAVPNGALDQIEMDLANLLARGDAVLTRLQRIA